MYQRLFDRCRLPFHTKVYSPFHFVMMIEVLVVQQLAGALHFQLSSFKINNGVNDHVAI